MHKSLQFVLIGLASMSGLTIAPTIAAAQDMELRIGPGGVGVYDHPPRESTGSGGQEHLHHKAAYAETTGSGGPGSMTGTRGRTEGRVNPGGSGYVGS